MTAGQPIRDQLLPRDTTEIMKLANGHSGASAMWYDACFLNGRFARPLCWPFMPLNINRLVPTFQYGLAAGDAAFCRTLIPMYSSYYTLSPIAKERSFLNTIRALWLQHGPLSVREFANEDWAWFVENFSTFLQA